MRKREFMEKIIPILEDTNDDATLVIQVNNITHSLKDISKTECGNSIIISSGESNIQKRARATMELKDAETNR